MAYTYFDLDVARAIGGTFTGNVTWTDNSKAIFGTGGDVTISYDGTNFLINPAVVGSGELRIGGSTNYCAIQADGDLKFAGTAALKVPTNTAAFVSDAAPDAGLFFSSVGSLTGYQFRDTSGVRCAQILVDGGSIFDFGVSFPHVSPTQITANQNNYAGIGQAGYGRLDLDAARTITGILQPTNGEGGKLLYITNISAFTLTLNHQDAASTAANRIIGIAGANTNVAAGQNTCLIYDTTTNRWRILFVQ